MQPFNTFKTHSVSKDVQFNISPEMNAKISLESPAMSVMHGFHLVPPQLIEGNTSIDEALLILDKTHMRTSFVVDSDNKLLGVISKARLSSSYILKYVEKSGVNREDMTVSHIMVQLTQLHTVSEFAMRSAKVGDVLATLEKNGHEHLLVVSQPPAHLCGYFDLIDMARMVDRPLSQVKKASSFTEIVDSLWHHSEI